MSVSCQDNTGTLFGLVLLSDQLQLYNFQDLSQYSPNWSYVWSDYFSVQFFRPSHHGLEHISRESMLFDTMSVSCQDHAGTIDCLVFLSDQLQLYNFQNLSQYSLNWSYVWSDNFWDNVRIVFGPCWNHAQCTCQC